MEKEALYLMMGIYPNGIKVLDYSLFPEESDNKFKINRIRKCITF